MTHLLILIYKIFFKGEIYTEKKYCQDLFARYQVHLCETEFIIVKWALQKSYKLNLTNLTFGEDNFYSS